MRHQRQQVTERPACRWCDRTGTAAGLQAVTPGDPVFLKDAALDGTILCRGCRYDVITGRV